MALIVDYRFIKCWHCVIVIICWVCLMVKNKLHKNI
jgi:hypothetical protein